MEFRMPFVSEPDVICFRCQHDFGEKPDEDTWNRHLAIHAKEEQQKSDQQEAFGRNVGLAMKFTEMAVEFGRPVTEVIEEYRTAMAEVVKNRLAK